MDRFEAVRTLIAAVDGGSLSAASRNLRTPLPTVSRRVSDLEAQLGAQLVIRTSRNLVLSEAGAAYVAAMRRVLDQVAEAERAAAGEYLTPRGELIVTAPVLFGNMHVAPIVHDFLAAYPEVAVRLILSDGNVDFVENHVDVAIRIGALPDSTLIARRVGAVNLVVCASPAYLARRGEPTLPASLVEHDCIAFEGLRTARSWAFGSGARVQSVTIRPRFSVNSADAVVAAAVAGLGIAQVMSYQAARAVAEQQLVALLQQDATDPRPVHLLHAPHPLLPLKLRAFLDFVAPRLKIVLERVERCYA